MTAKTALLLVVLVQTICATFLVAEMLSSIFGLPGWSISWSLYETIEILAAIGLIGGVAIGSAQLRQGLARVEKAEGEIAALSQAFADQVQEYFDAWGLTKSERDVALFLIKGFSTAEIAAFRNSSEGTVKAQCNAVYTKADVSSRAQLVGVLIEDLMQVEFFGSVSLETSRKKKAS